MLLSFTSRGLSLRTLLISAVLIATVASANDRMRDDPPAQGRMLPVATDPIDPTSFCEPVLGAAIFQETNHQRAALHLPAFLPDEKASTAARRHAEWMAGTHVLSHEEPSAQGPPITSLDRLRQQGLQPHATAENIAYNLLPDITPGKAFYTRLVSGHPVYSYQPGGPPRQAHTYDGFARLIVTQWMQSPLHRANIVNPEYRFLGVGVALAHRRGRPDTIYGVQEFFTPRIPPDASTISHATATLLPPRP